MRQVWADSLTGLCILYMIAMHVSLFVKTPIVGGEFFFFFMPWFFFKSGMYFKARPAMQLFIKDAKRLLVPYVVFVFFGWLLYRPFTLGQTILSDTILAVKSIVAVGGVFWNSPLWFLLVLFIIRQIHNLYLNIMPNHQRMLLIEALVSFLVAMSLSILMINRPLWVPNVFLGLVYFVIGSFLKERIDNLSNNHMAIAIIVGLYIASFFMLGSTNFEANTADNGVTGYLFWLLFSIVGILMFAFCLIRLPWLNVRPLISLGMSSMTYYVVHWPLIFIANELLKPHLSGYDLYATILSFVFIMGYLIDLLLHNNKFKFLIGL